MDHKFAIGQTIVLENIRLQSGHIGEFKVVRLLPEHQYRVRSVTNDHERVVQENDVQARRPG
jgi:hypothetical protein